MSNDAMPEMTVEGNGDRKAWVTPAVILSDVRATEASVTRFTDGISTGPFHFSYGS